MARITDGAWEGLLSGLQTKLQPRHMGTMGWQMSCSTPGRRRCGAAALAGLLTVRGACPYPAFDLIVVLARCSLSLFDLLEGQVYDSW